MMRRVRAVVGVGCVGVSCVLAVLFFKRKRAYEMRISDGSSDVCSSDLLIPFENERATDRGDRALVSLNEDITRLPGFRVLELPVVDGRLGQHAKLDDVEIYFPFGTVEIGRASCKERVCQYV